MALTQAIDQRAPLATNRHAERNGQMNKDRVKDVMTSLVVMVAPNEPTDQVAARLVRNRISGAPVVKDGKVIGVISEIDIARARTRAANLEGPPTATDVMSTPVVTIGSEAGLIRAAQLLDRYGIKRLPVVDEDGYLLGIVSRGDLVRSMAQGAREMV